MRPTLDANGRVMLVVVDCLRLDQWAMIRPLVERFFDVEVDHYFSILPTATPYSRNAIFSGLYPGEMIARHPDLVERQARKHRSTPTRASCSPSSCASSPGRDVPVHYEKVFSAAEGEQVLKRLSAHLSGDGVTALVFNFIDQLTHGRTENDALFEVARDTSALRTLTRTWFERLGALRGAQGGGAAARAGAAHHRPWLDPLPYAGDDLCAPGRDRQPALQVRRGVAGRGPRRGAGRRRSRRPGGCRRGPTTTRLLLATGDRFFVYPTKLREYQARYRGAFLHGGVSPEEVVLPIALLTPRRG